MQIYRIFMVEWASKKGDSLMDPGSGTPGSIGKFPGNFLMRSLFSCIWRICEPPILDLSSQGGSIRKFPGNFLMDPGSSDPVSIRKFLRNFLMDPRKRLKKKFGSGQPASQQPASQQASQLSSHRSANQQWGAGGRGRSP